MEGAAVSERQEVRSGREMQGHPSILVVDDEPSIREFLSFVLGDEGFRVSTAADGIEALEAARQSPPDVVLTDLMMPGLDGYGLINGLRRNHVPVRAIIAMSAVHTAQDRNLRADLFIAKPFHIDQIIAAVHALLER
jgi:DNA-binding response OmpR family regulator